MNKLSTYHGRHEFIIRLFASARRHQSKIQWHCRRSFAGEHYSYLSDMIIHTINLGAKGGVAPGGQSLPEGGLLLVGKVEIFAAFNVGGRRF